MIAYNSRVYYVITQGAGIGDSVRRLPVTGNETGLDALAQVGGLSQVSSTKIWIARPAPHNFGCQQILPIDWYAITQGAQTATNYQIMPGDRVYVAEDEMVTFTNVLTKVTAPLERMLGIAFVEQFHDPWLADFGPELQPHPQRLLAWQSGISAPC